MAGLRAEKSTAAESPLRETRSIEFKEIDSLLEPRIEPTVLNTGSDSPLSEFQQLRAMPRPEGLADFIAGGAVFPLMGFLRFFQRPPKPELPAKIYTPEERMALTRLNDRGFIDNHLDEFKRQLTGKGWFGAGYGLLALHGVAELVLNFGVFGFVGAAASAFGMVRMHQRVQGEVNKNFPYARPEDYELTLKKRFDALAAEVYRGQPFEETDYLSFLQGSLKQGMDLRVFWARALRGAPPYLVETMLNRVYRDRLGEKLFLIREGRLKGGANLLLKVLALDGQSSSAYIWLLNTLGELGVKETLPAVRRWMEVDSLLGRLLAEDSELKLVEAARNAEQSILNPVAPEPTGFRGRYFRLEGRLLTLLYMSLGSRLDPALIPQRAAEQAVAMPNLGAAVWLMACDYLVRRGGELAPALPRLTAMLGNLGQQSRDRPARPDSYFDRWQINEARVLEQVERYLRTLASPGSRATVAQRQSSQEAIQRWEQEKIAGNGLAWLRRLSGRGDLEFTARLELAASFYELGLQKDLAAEVVKLRARPLSPQQRYPLADYLVGMGQVHAAKEELKILLRDPYYSIKAGELMDRVWPGWERFFTASKP